MEVQTLQGSPSIAIHAMQSSRQPLWRVASPTLATLKTETATARATGTGTTEIASGTGGATTSVTLELLGMSWTAGGTAETGQESHIQTKDESRRTRRPEREYRTGRMAGLTNPQTIGSPADTIRIDPQKTVIGDTKETTTGGAVAITAPNTASSPTTAGHPRIVRLTGTLIGHLRLIPAVGDRQNSLGAAAAAKMARIPDLRDAARTARKREGLAMLPTFQAGTCLLPES